MRRKLGYIALCFVPGLLVVAYLNSIQVRPDVVCPVPFDQLGLVDDHEEHAAVVAQGMPRFAIFGAVQDNAKKNVRLWDAVLKIRGSHLPNVPQQIGDCVSHGSANAENFLQYQQIDEGHASEFHEAYPPYNYGASRVTIGKKYGSHFSGDGSVGAYAAEAARDCGVLAADHPQCPPYSGSIAKQWGRSGPPKWADEAASPNRVQTIAQMETSDDVRDAVCNRYPVVICSSFGTATIRPQDGRMVAKHDASWPHCMCIIAYDGSGKQPYWYVLNSWGPQAHPDPMQGEPPGGFWIDKRSLDYIVKTGDCWAYSAFEGFPAEELDLSPLRPHKVQRVKPVDPRNQRPVDPFNVAQRSFGGSKL